VTVTIGRQGWGGPDVPGNVLVKVGTPAPAGPGLARVATARALVVHRLERRTLTFDVSALPVRVVVDVHPTFSPAQFAGYTDTRQLGAQVSFSFQPR
jgi:hypothetical protein